MLDLDSSLWECPFHCAPIKQTVVFEINLLVLPSVKTTTETHFCISFQRYTLCIYDILIYGNVFCFIKKIHYTVKSANVFSLFIPPSLSRYPLFVFLYPLSSIDWLMWSLVRKRIMLILKTGRSWKLVCFCQIRFTFLKRAWRMTHTQCKPWFLEQIETINSISGRLGHQKQCLFIAEMVGK